VIALIKSLPKSLRRHLVPAPNYAAAFLERTELYKNDLFTSLEYEFKKMTGVNINRDDWQLDQVPDHLKMTFNIVDEHNKSIFIGKDLNALKDQLKDKVQQVLTKITQTKNNEIEKNNLINWDFGNLPKVYERKQQNYMIKAYPTLVDEGNSVAIKLVEREDEQVRLMQQGIKRLIYLNIPSPVKYLHEKLPNKAKLGLYFNPFGKISDLIDDCIYCGINHLIEKYHGIIFEQVDFSPLLDKVKGDINEVIVSIASQVERILTLNYTINKKLKGRLDLNMALSLADIKQQLSRLIYKGFVADTSYKKLPDLYRYLQAIDKRIDKLYIDPNKDRSHLIAVEQVTKQYSELCQNREQNKIAQQQLIQLRWMIEEFRVNLFAQQLGTPYPISEKRINQFIDEIKQ